MVLGGRTSHGMKLHRSGMTVGMNLGIARGKKGQENWDESWSWPAIEDQQPGASAGGTTQGVQSLVLSPLISEIFVGFSTGLTLETEISDVFDDVCSHFSTDETVFRVESTFLHVSKLHDCQ